MIVLRLSSSCVIAIVHFIGFCPLIGHFNFATLGLYYFATTHFSFFTEKFDLKIIHGNMVNDNNGWCNILSVKY